MNLIKDKTLVHSEEPNLSGGKNYVIEKGTKLSQAFNFLPHGVIDKTQTGIGGTSCELDAKRPSIIVQPYVSTAKSKAGLKTIDNKFKVHFYGRNRAGASVKSKNISTVTDQEPDLALMEYLRFCELEHQPAKITCVADQLTNLKASLNVISEDKFDEFHLVLDEIDSLQEQSNFRDVMDDCYAIYKQHPPNRRSVISATIKKFHDPGMADEPISTISEHGATKNNLLLIRTSDLEEELTKQLIEYLASNKTNKIVVACNHIQTCLKVIANLEKVKSLDRAEAKILCSPSRKALVKDLLGEVLPNGFLPARLNFITAAYFNGVDINEPYHNLIIADSTSASLRLSPSVVFQISGRCRAHLLSNKLMVKIVVNNRYPFYTLEQLEEHAGEFVEAQKFYQTLISSKNPLANASAEGVLNIYLEGADTYPAIATKDSSGALVLSYLKIDNRLEQQATVALYKSFDLLKEGLAERFLVQVEEPLHKKKSESKKLVIDLKAKCDELLAQIEELLDKPELGKGLNSLKSGFELEFKPVGVSICEIYARAQELPEVEMKKVTHSIHEILKTRTYRNGLKLLETHLHLKKLFLYDSDVMEQLNSQFPDDLKLSEDNLITQCKAFAKFLVIYSRTLNKTIRNRAKELAQNPKLVAGSLLQLEKARDSKLRYSKVIGFRPFDIYR